jgi:hypothetical protein
MRLQILTGVWLVALAGQAAAWNVQERVERVIVTHEMDGLTVEVGCRAAGEGRLGVRISGLDGDALATVVARVQQPDGSVNEFEVPANGSATTVEGRLRSPGPFLDALAQGSLLQLIADGTLVMETGLDGTAEARARIAAVCGI